MIHGSVRLLSFALAATLLAGTAHADDVKLCNETRGPEALAACDRAIASKEHTGVDLAKLHTNRGVERRRKKDHDGAIEDYSEAIRLNPEDPFAYNNRANVWRDKGDLDAAIADYTAALKIDPGYTAGYINRARVYEQKHDNDAARADYETALARPAKYANGRAGQEMARRRLKLLGQKL